MSIIKALQDYDQKVEDMIQNLRNDQIRIRISPPKTKRSEIRDLARSRSRAQMEFRIEKGAFIQGLYFAQGIADRRSTMPILANVLLRTDGPERIIVAATDLNITVTTEIPCEVISEGGLTVGAKSLHEIIKSLPGDRVSFKRAENQYAEISAGKVNYKVVGLADRDFPRLPNHREVQYAKADAAALRDLISKTFFSISADETRYHLNGVLFETEGTGDKAFGRMVSTDGHRLTKCERPMPGAPPLSPGVLVPRKGLMELRRALESSPNTVELGLDQGHIFLRTGQTALSVKLNDAQFPPYEQVIPRDYERLVVVEKAALLGALKRIMLVASDKTYGVKLSVSKNALRIESDNPDIGHAQEELEVAYDNKPLVIGFNARYMIDILNEVDTDQVQLELNGELDPGVMRPTDKAAGPGNNYLGVVMPKLPRD